ncbi:hypothetical protein JQX08_08320 [Pseudomonas sp. UL073]|uniref:Uncharacterized protein n=1 Tax=Zestomonas insulae TaxID=2809017 RepID=A0ABS2IFL1_9GAMM|nr:hypothetical protein [Pseudomonas insulae]
MSNAIRTLRKTLDTVAANNEAAAIDVMRAAERIADATLKQQLFDVIHRMNVDAAELRSAREQVVEKELRRA